MIKKHILHGIAGFVRRDEITGEIYGKELNEGTINIMAQIAIRGDIPVEDIIYGRKTISEPNPYDKYDNVVRKLMISMNNN